ncbi:MAG: 30S ribosomal protein S18, partial [Anaerolineales bacterium]
MDQERRAPRGRDEDAGEEEIEERGRGFSRRKPVFQFGAENGKQINYKNVEVLRQLINERGKIRPRRQTGASARFQRRIAVAIKRARHMALLPFD